MTDLKPVKLFYSYSHRDEELRTELESHLAILKRKSMIEEWHDRKILSGKTWEQEIDNELERADIILLLISADFVASDYCYGVEIKKALDRHEAKQATVIPIILRPTDWQEESFAKLQALPKDGLAVTMWANRDEAWLDVAKGIRKAVSEIHKSKDRIGQKFGLMSVDSLLRESIRGIEKKYSILSHCSGANTGYYTLDRYIDGLHSSDFIVVAARPDMGKTDLLVNLALNLSVKCGEHIAFFSLKLPSENIMCKLICAESGVDNLHYSRGRLLETDWPKLLKAAGLLHEANIFVDDSPKLTLAQLEDKISNFEKDHPNCFIFIDTLNHLLESAECGHDYTSHVSRSLKAIAKELKITIIASAPVSRNVDSRWDKRPTINDLEKWNCINEDADVVSFLYREQYPDDHHDSNIVELILGKNRKGPTGTLTLRYDSERCRFEDLSESTINDKPKPEDECQTEESKITDGSGEPE